MKRLVLRRSLQILLVIAGICLIALWVVLTKDYGEYFAERKGRLSSVSLTPVESDGHFRKAWLTLRGTDGLNVDCGMLTPADTTRRYPAIVLLGGKATGKYAVNYALNIEDVIIIAPDYPYEPRRSYTVLEFLGDVPEMRGALLDMVPSAMLLLDYLRQRSDVDTGRVVLLGYSFGAPLVPAIIAHDRRPAVAAMVYAGGDLHSLIRHNVRRHEGPIVSEVVATLGALLLDPLEPMRYAGRIPPTPLVMINGLHDEQIPRDNAEQFYNAVIGPKNIIWLESMHVHPKNVDLTRMIIDTLKAELGALGILPTHHHPDP